MGVVECHRQNSKKQTIQWQATNISDQQHTISVLNFLKESSLLGLSSSVVDEHELLFM